MLVGFVGDVHGRVFHMLAAVATWQRASGRPFDLIIQVGDMGAFPDPATVDSATRSYLALDPSEGDFARLLGADGERAEGLVTFQTEFRSPVLFIHGNHDDLGWLRSLTAGCDGTVEVDRFGLLRHVPDGTLIERNGTTFASLGGEDRPGREGDIDADAYHRLLTLEPGECDVLVTHDAPYGLATGRDGRPQGSSRISALLAHLCPKIHVAGHYHHLNGPRVLGATTTLALSSLVPSVRWQPDASGLQSGCLAVLDTDTWVLSPVVDPWLSSFPTPFLFDRWLVGNG